MKFFKIFLAGVLAFVVGSIVMLLLSILTLAGIVGSMGDSTAVEKGSVLKIDFAEMITEAPQANPLGGFDLWTMESTPQLSLFSAIRAIDAAAADDRIEGIYIRPSGGGWADAAAIEELREALLHFKESGKFIFAYDETYSQGLYYLASAADRICMHPQGGMEWTGLSQQLMFYKGLLDKLDVKVEVFRPTVCKYKSAVEPWIRKDMSPENRLQMQAFIDSAWGTITEAVSASRGIPVGELNRFADELAVTLPEDAVACGLVDSLLYEDQLCEMLLDAGVEPDEEEGYRYVTLGEYAAQLGADMKHLTSPEVAVLYADGQIYDGQGGGGNIFGNTLAAQLRELRLDEKVAAVVVRVNSPGGSALASDVIWREMELLKAEKPVIVSMGQYAASGGYYISAPADAILADKMTLTGSIGVFGRFFYTTDALKNKLGVTLDAVRTNRSAGMGSTAPLTAAERASILRSVDRVYETFTGLVAKGRNLPIETVLDIAGGRIWSGSDALSIGLVDGLGGLKSAIAVAADKAGLGEDFRIAERIEEPTGFAAILSTFMARVQAAVRPAALAPVAEQCDAVERALSQQGLVMDTPYRIELK